MSSAPWALEDVRTVVNSEHDAPDRKGIHRSVAGTSADRFGRVERVKLDASVAVRRTQPRRTGPAHGRSHSLFFADGARGIVSVARSVARRSMTESARI